MKNKQGITIAALIIAIVGLSIGFAAFSNTLNISSSASVNPDASALKVVFAKDYFTEQKTTLNQLDTTAVVPTTAGTGVTATNGVINNDGQDGPTLTGLSAAFTAPGQSVTYNLYVVNAGQLKAYLTDIVFGTTGSPAKAVSCTVAQTKKVNDTTVNLTDEEKATESLVDAACEGISVSVTIGELPTKTSSGSLNNLPLEVKGYEPVQIVITYATGSAYVDGPMNVAFGDIEINASSVGTEIATPENPSEDDSCTVINVKSFGACTVSQDNDSSGTVTKGDKVTCGTESFYVIENPSNGTTKMLAEWNLNISEPGNMEGAPIEIPYSYTYCESTTGYQDSHVRGATDSSENLYTVTVEYQGQTMSQPWPYGTVKFDRVTIGNDGYWAPGGSLNTSVYTENTNGGYPAYVYDNNATLKTFVDTYVGYLNSQVSGANAVGRLINTLELEALGCNVDYKNCEDSAYSWIYQTSYWSGSARSFNAIQSVSSSGNFETGKFNEENAFGVRPVIEISSSAIH